MTDSSAETHKLTAKQQAFIDAYVGEARFNASKAALIAGYSEKSAGQLGWQLLQIPTISARIKEILESRALSAEGVLAELADVATSEWRDHVEVLMYDREGNPVKTKMDLSSKVKSLEIIAKAHGLLKENVSVSGNVGLYSFDGIPEETP